MKLNQIYVINLNTPNEDIVNKINKLNLPYRVGYEIVPAVNGWNLIENNIQLSYQYNAASWWKIDSDFKFYNRDVTPGELGCALSHFNIIKQAYKDNFENVLILEEDFNPLRSFPDTSFFESLPKDFDLLYIGRNAINPDKETSVGTNFIKVDYSYNNHAYVVSRAGMKKIIESDFLTNIIPWDEFIPALNGTSNRKDAVQFFCKNNFTSYSLDSEYISQTSKTDSTSTTEFNPAGVPRSSTQQPNLSLPKSGVLNDTDWGEWVKKYINPLIINKEYDLIIDEPAPHIFTFPFFTELFCKEMIELSEKFQWTTDRHEFYPTTDNLLQVLGMDKIYNKLINEFVRPLAIDRYGLEGSSWSFLRDESFIIKYPHTQQSHLSLHHDHASITTLVNLNPGEFEGGGTYFPKFKCLVNPKEVGVMTLHPSNITHKHGARPVTKGTRYVIVSFIKNKNFLD